MCLSARMRKKAQSDIIRVLSWEIVGGNPSGFVITVTLHVSRVSLFDPPPPAPIANPCALTHCSAPPHSASNQLCLSRTLSGLPCFSDTENIITEGMKHRITEGIFPKAGIEGLIRHKWTLFWNYIGKTISGSSVNTHMYRETNCAYVVSEPSKKLWILIVTGKKSILNLPPISIFS